MPTTAPSISTSSAHAIDKSTTYWFVACQFVVRTKDDTFTREPGSMAHAKQMGTTQTACGIDATSWYRLWEVPFDATSENTCPRCRVIASRAHG